MRRYLVWFFIIVAALQFTSCRNDKPAMLELMRLADSLNTPGNVDSTIELTPQELLQHSSFTDWRVLGRNVIGAFCHVSNDIATVRNLTAGNYFLYTDYQNIYPKIMKIDDNEDGESSYRFFERYGNENVSSVAGPVGYNIRGNRINFCKGIFDTYEENDTITWSFTTTENANYDANALKNAMIVNIPESSGGFLIVNSPDGFTLFTIAGHIVLWDSPTFKNGFFLRDFTVNYLNEAYILVNFSDGSLPSKNQNCLLMKFELFETPVFEIVHQLSSNTLYEHFCLFGNLLYVMNESEMWWSLDYGKTRNPVPPLVNYRSLVQNELAIEGGNAVMLEGEAWKIIGNIPIEGYGHIIQKDYWDEYIVGTEDGKLYTGGFLNDMNRIF